MLPIIAEERLKYHLALIQDKVLTIDSKGIASNADRENRKSATIAGFIADAIGSRIKEQFAISISLQNKQSAQTLGTSFEKANTDFLTHTFPKLQILRPGQWTISQLGNNSSIKTSSFYQYEHLSYLSELTKANTQLASILGNNYIVAPDIVIYRLPEEDTKINSQTILVDDSVSTLTPIRKRFNELAILHASISVKWTMRSDRAQNSRTEALGLIRNRKGSLPHIIVVTGEPLPSRLASLALGTGDIDCLYHFALYELENAVKKLGDEDTIEQLHTLIKGKRLKDISDLPLDLSI